MISEPMKSRSSVSSRSGFTMIELMVVVGIITMAAGIMTPTILDFMANRELEGVRGQFGNIFNMARLRAVNQRRDISVVFFQEGPRVFDELRKDFVDDDVWLPKNSALRYDPQRAGQPNNPKMWYALGFAGGASSYDKKHEETVNESRTDRQKTIPRSIPSFENWQQDPRSRLGAPAGGSRRSSRRNSVPGRTRFRTNDLYKLTFNRNGTMVFSAGCSDVPTSIFNNDTHNGRPRTADVVILQFNSQKACFIDVRPTGQVRSKVKPLRVAPTTPGDVSSVRGSKKEPVRSGRSARKKSRK